MNHEGVNIVNCTDHRISIMHGDQVVAMYRPSGHEARVDEESIEAGELNGIPVSMLLRGDVVNMPDPQNNTVYLVSKHVLFHPSIAHRCDVMAPDMVVYDSNHRKIACRQFVGTQALARQLIIIEVKRGEDTGLRVFHSRKAAGVFLLEVRHTLTCVKITVHSKVIHANTVPSVKWILNWINS